MVEQITKLTDIIRTESEVIDALFLLLLQHVSAEELAPIVDRISGISDDLPL